MAWPVTPLTTYVSGTTPAIKAVDLNAIQGTINDLVNGEVTVASLATDGAGGGNPAIAVPGTAFLGASASGVATPTVVVPWGRMYKEAALFGKALVGSSGAFQHGYNILSTTRVGAGHYEILFNGAPTNPGRATGEVTPVFNSVFRVPELNSFNLVGSDLQAVVFLYSGPGTLADGNFYIHAWGG